MYESRLKAILEPGRKGEFVAIDLPSGDYFTGSEALEAYRKASQKHPGRVFVIKRIGYPAVRRLGAGA